MSPSADTAMLIRRPAAEVFDAFVDPAITAKFWFTSGSAPLRDVGQVVRWEWSWYGLVLHAEVLEIAPPSLLKLAWPVGRGLIVDIDFEPLSDAATFVQIRQAGFADDPDGHKEARDATEGFALVLAGAKAWLEHGLELGLVPDRFPHASFSRPARSSDWQ